MARWNRQEEKQHKRGLESQKKKRAALLAELANNYVLSVKKLRTYARDEQQLNSLIKETRRNKQNKNRLNWRKRKTAQRKIT